jgi:hypothetical protein
MGTERVAIIIIIIIMIIITNNIDNEYEHIVYSRSRIIASVTRCNIITVVFYVVSFCFFFCFLSTWRVICATTTTSRIRPSVPKTKKIYIIYNGLYIILI